MQESGCYHYTCKAGRLQEPMDIAFVCKYRWEALKGQNLSAQGAALGTQEAMKHLKPCKGVIILTQHQSHTFRQAPTFAVEKKVSVIVYFSLLASQEACYRYTCKAGRLQEAMDIAFVCKYRWEALKGQNLSAQGAALGTQE